MKELVTQKATGPVLFRFFGDEDAGKSYVGIGRSLLGQMKGYMNLAGITSYRHDTKLTEGVGIRTQSNANGLAAIDEVWISVPILPKENKMQSKCIGYIIQFDTTSSASPAARIPFVLTDPKGKVFNSWRMTSYRNVWDNKFGYLNTDLTFTGFPIGGAKDFPLYDSSKEGANLSDNGLEELYVAHSQGHDGEGEMPYWRHPSLSIAPFIGYGFYHYKHAENVGYMTISSYKFDNGNIVLGIPVNAAANGITHTLFMMDFGPTKKFRLSDQIINGWYDAVSTSSTFFNPYVNDGWTVPITVRDGVHKIEAYCSTLFKATIKLFMSNGEIETWVADNAGTHNTDTNMSAPSGRISDTTLADLTIKINVGVASDDPSRLGIIRHD